MSEIQSYADKQTRFYPLTLAIDDPALEEAIMDSLAETANKPVSQLKTAGEFGAALHSLVLAALADYLGVGE
jgi:hypothetical protein